MLTSSLSSLGIFHSFYLQRSLYSLSLKDSKDNNALFRNEIENALKNNFYLAKNRKLEQEISQGEDRAIASGKEKVSSKAADIISSSTFFPNTANDHENQNTVVISNHSNNFLSLNEENINKNTSEINTIVSDSSNSSLSFNILPKISSSYFFKGSKAKLPFEWLDDTILPQDFFFKQETLNLYLRTKENEDYVLTHGNFKSGFPTYEEANFFLEFLMIKYGSHVIRRYQIGESYMKKPIYAYRVGGFLKRANLKEITEREKKEEEMTRKTELFLRNATVGNSFSVESNLSLFTLHNFTLTDFAECLVTSLHHAREPLSLDVLLYFISHLLRDFTLNEPQALYILSCREIWLIPFVNPDGYQDIHKLKKYKIRKNRRITCPTANETSEVQGVDLNRNYDWSFKRSNDGCNEQEYEGEYAFSEPETKAVKRLVEEYKTKQFSKSYYSFSSSTPTFTLFRSFKTAVNLHSYGGFWTHPWNFNASKPLPLKAKGFFDELALMLKVRVFDSAPKIPVLMYVTTGEADDWMIGAHNVMAMSPEVGDENCGKSENCNSDLGFFPPNYQIYGVMKRNYRRLMGVMLKSGLQLNVQAKMNVYKNKDSENLRNIPKSVQNFLLKNSSYEDSNIDDYLIYSIEIANTGLTGSIGYNPYVAISGAILPISLLSENELKFLSKLNINNYILDKASSRGYYAGSKYKSREDSEYITEKITKTKENNKDKFSNDAIQKDKSTNASFPNSRASSYDFSSKFYSDEYTKKSRRENIFGFNDLGNEIKMRLYIPHNNLKVDPQRNEITTVSFPIKAFVGRSDNGTEEIIDVQRFFIIIPNDSALRETRIPICITESIASVFQNVVPSFICHCGLVDFKVNDYWIKSAMYIESSETNELCDSAVRIANAEISTEQEKSNELLHVGFSQYITIALLLALIQSFLLLIALGWCFFQLKSICAFKNTSSFHQMDGATNIKENALKSNMSKFFLYICCCLKMCFIKQKRVFPVASSEANHNDRKRKDRREAKYSQLKSDKDYSYSTSTSPDKVVNDFFMTNALFTEEGMTNNFKLPTVVIGVTHNTDEATYNTSSFSRYSESSSAVSNDDNSSFYFEEYLRKNGKKCLENAYNSSNTNNISDHPLAEYK